MPVWLVFFFHFCFTFLVQFVMFLLSHPSTYMLLLFGSEERCKSIAVLPNITLWDCISSQSCSDRLMAPSIKKLFLVNKLFVH